MACFMSQNETKWNYFSPPFCIYSLALNDVIYCSSTLNILRDCLVRSEGGKMRILDKTQG